MNWIANPYVWIVIIVTIIIVWLSVINSRFTDDWYKDSEKPVGMIPDWGFSVIWGLLYTGLLIAAVISVARASPSHQMGLTILYATLMAYTLGWVLSFVKMEGSFISLIMMLILVVLVMFMIISVRSGPHDHGNAFVKHFPAIMFSMFAVWVIVATYYTTGFLVLNNEPPKITE